MAGEERQADIDLAADRLGDAEEDAADERPPQAAEAADDDGLEAEDQQDRAGEGIEIDADAR